MRFSVFFILYLISVSIYAQQKEIIYSIIENYDKPHFTHWSVSDEFNKREVVDGVYTAKSLTVLGPKLSFEHNINQFNCLYSSEMEFTLKKIKGAKEAFIGVKFTIQTNNSVNYPQFLYNSLGEWKLFKDRGLEKASGATSVNEGDNVLRVVFNKTYMEFYLNDHKVVEHNLYVPHKLEWRDIQILGDKKTVIGLDKLVLTAYYDEENPDISSFVVERYMNGVSSLGYQKGFVLKQENKKYRFVSLRGRISEIEFDEYTSGYSGPLIRFGNKEPKRYGYLDQNGKVMYQADFTEAASSPCNAADIDCISGFYKVKDRDGIVLFVNEKGEQKKD